MPGPLAAAAASPVRHFVGLRPVHVVAAAAASAWTPGAPPSAAFLRAAAPREETGRRPLPGPAPASSQSVRSVRPPARSRFRPSVQPPTLGPISPLRPLCLSLAQSLVSALALPPSPSLAPPDLVLLRARLIPQSLPSRSAPGLFGTPSERPLIFWEGAFFQNTFHTTRTSLWGSSLPSVPPHPGGLALLSPCRLCLLVSPYTLGPLPSLGVSPLGPPKPPAP